MDNPFFMLKPDGTARGPPERIDRHEDAVIPLELEGRAMKRLRELLSRMEKRNGRDVLGGYGCVRARECVDRRTKPTALAAPGQAIRAHASQASGPASRN